jgi:hypothetical protein
VDRGELLVLLLRRRRRGLVPRARVDERAGLTSGGGGKGQAESGRISPPRWPREPKRHRAPALREGAGGGGATDGVEGWRRRPGRTTGKDAI